MFERIRDYITGRRYREYHGKDVRVLVDAKAGCHYGNRPGTDLDLRAILAEETRRDLILKDVSSKSYEVLLDKRGSQGRFPRAKISKRRVIGVFEEKIEEEESSGD